MFISQIIAILFAQIWLPIVALDSTPQSISTPPTSIMLQHDWLPIVWEYYDTDTSNTKLHIYGIDHAWYDDGSLSVFLYNINLEHEYNAAEMPIIENTERCQYRPIPYLAYNANHGLMLCSISALVDTDGMVTFTLWDTVVKACLLLHRECTPIRHEVVTFNPDNTLNIYGLNGTYDWPNDIQTFVVHSLDNMVLKIYARSKKEIPDACITDNSIHMATGSQYSNSVFCNLPYRYHGFDIEILYAERWHTLNPNAYVISSVRNPVTE